MNQNLTRYIWTHTRAQQIWILIVVVVSMYTYFLSFDLPKLIVNGPIQGKGFDNQDATQNYLRLAFDLPVLGHVELFGGFQLDRLMSLWFLCGIFLLLVIINGAFKYYINTYKGRLGERMLRRIRFDLIDRLLRFPPSQFKRVKPSEISTMVKDEVEPLGGFIGDAFVQPVLLGGQAATALVFILIQNMWLGMVSVAVMALQLILIPKMRKRLLRLSRERQLTARDLAGRIGEISEGISTVHAHDTSNFERADMAARLHRIFKIRYDLYQWKFLVKFINNFLAQITPFLFYVIGGYQAIRGDLDIGQLVAVIAAYKDLPGPLKDLIDWDQARQDVAVKYAQVYEQFNVDEMIEPYIQAIDATDSEPITAPLSTANLSLTDDSGAALLERISLKVEPGETIAILGTAGGGGEFFAEALARLIWPDSGNISVGSKNLFELPESITGRRISYAAADTYIFQGSLRDNLLYSLKHAPITEPVYAGADAIRRKWEIAEAKGSGNPAFDINSDWINYKAAAATGPDDLINAILPILDAVQLSDEIFDLGLRSSPQMVNGGHISMRIVEVREAFRKRLEQENLGDLVVPFEMDSYNTEAKISENLLFGTATDTAFNDGNLASNPYFRSVLKDLGLEDVLFDAGLEIASNAVELFRDLPPDHPFFQQLTFMTSEEIPEYQLLLSKLKGRGIALASGSERSRIIGLSFSYIEPRHRFGILDDALMARIVAARRRFHASMPANLKGSIEQYNTKKYNTSANLIDNILVGRNSQRHADGPERIRKIVRDILRELGLFQGVIEIGLEYAAGVGGKRLTLGQRQKLNLARALLKRADFIILNRPLTALDQQIQRKIAASVLAITGENGRKPAVIWVLSNAALATMFDRIVVFDRGRIVGDGDFDRLMAGNTVFQRLLS